MRVTVALTTLLGCDELPGELDGHGPVPAALARQIAADPTGSWQRFVTDSAGRLVDSSRAYTPPRLLRDHVRDRDRTCRFPGCSRGAVTCETDHRIPFGPAGGRTTEDNLHILCPRHHHLKHEAGWSVHLRSDQTTRWTTPTGRTYDKPPPTYDTG